MCEYRFGVCKVHECNDRDNRFVFDVRDSTFSKKSDRDGRDGESSIHNSLWETNVLDSSVSELRGDTKEQRWGVHCSWPQILASLASGLKDRARDSTLRWSSILCGSSVSVVLHFV